MQTARWTSWLSLLAAAAVLGWGLAIAWAAREHLRGQGGEALAVPALGGAALAAACVALLPRFVRGKALQRGLAWMIIAAAVVLPASAFWPGGVTYARFGFTVVGACPIPAFDFSITEAGWISACTKSHRITLAEASALTASGAEILIIATGWDQVARVDAEVLKMPRVAVEVLPTGAAFQRYNKLRREGRRVALLAHTTC